MPFAFLPQTFHEGHDDDISCLAISQDRQFVATDQVGNKPYIQIWHAVSCANLCTLPSFHKRGIADLAFSQDDDGGSKQLISVGQGDNHLHAVWRDIGGHWSKVAMVASARGDGAKVRTSEASDTRMHNSTTPTLTCFLVFPGRSSSLIGCGLEENIPW